jgi:hypothetical protein
MKFKFYEVNALVYAIDYAVMFYLPIPKLKVEEGLQQFFGTEIGS